MPRNQVYGIYKLQSRFLSIKARIFLCRFILLAGILNAPIYNGGENAAYVMFYKDCGQNRGWRQIRLAGCFSVFSARLPVQPESGKANSASGKPSQNHRPAFRAEGLHSKRRYQTIKKFFVFFILVLTKSALSFIIQKSSGVWLSLVERLVRDQEAGGSSPLTPTSGISREKSSHNYYDWTFSFLPSRGQTLCAADS